LRVLPNTFKMLLKSRIFNTPGQTALTDRAIVAKDTQIDGDRLADFENKLIELQDNFSSNQMI